MIWKSPSYKFKIRNEREEDFFSMKTICFFLLSIVFVLFLIPSALAVQSYPEGIAVTLFPPRTTQYNEGQEVTLLGQVTQFSGSQSTGEAIVGVPNAPYEILDLGSGQVITSGYTDDKGGFNYTWIAERINGHSKINLAAESYGVSSKEVSLQIYLVNYSPSQLPSPPPVQDNQSSSSDSNQTVLEFPIALPVLLTAIASMFIFYRLQKSNSIFQN